LTTARPIFTLLAATFVCAAAAGERCTALSGDTLRCGRERVRVEGLDAPAASAPGGEQARQRLQRRIRAGEVVIERRGWDKHGRILGRVYVDGNRVSQTDVDDPRPKAKARRL
jgi:endonuclease YncB( thermonuclease family)